jgi:hypothetical protein
MQIDPASDSEDVYHVMEIDCVFFETGCVPCAGNNGETTAHSSSVRSNIAIKASIASGFETDLQNNINRLNWVQTLVI